MPASACCTTQRCMWRSTVFDVERVPHNAYHYQCVQKPCGDHCIATLRILSNLGVVEVRVHVARLACKTP
eukprot:scaffold36856_cov30-Tisochrysis_lutea.AAC.2